MTLGLGMVNPYGYGFAQTLDPLNNSVTGYNTCIPTMSPLLNAGYGYGLNPFNTQYQIENMKQWDNFGVDRQVNMYKRQNTAQFEMSSQTETIARQAAILNEKIRNNDQDLVMAEYNKLLTAVKASYGNAATGETSEEKEKQYKAYADQVYFNQTGSTITQDLKKYGSDSFSHGFKKVVTFGMSNSKSAAANIAEIQGNSGTTSQKFLKAAGYTAGSIALGAGAVGIFKNAPAILKGITKAVKWIFTMNK